MKIHNSVLALVAALCAGNLFAAQNELHLTRILSISQVSSSDSDRSFELTYRRHCKDILQGAFVKLMPQPFITEHTHHMVGVVVRDSGRICAAADAIEKATVKVPYGDVVDRTPLLLQPGE